MAKIDDLVGAINETLTLYANEIREEVDKVSQESAKKLVKLTKDTAPIGNRQKHYKDFITSKKLSEGRYLWYVKAPEYRLSHLLNNGHATVDGGYVQGTNFIGKANDRVQKEYEEEIEKVIKNAD